MKNIHNKIEWLDLCINAVLNYIPEAHKYGTKESFEKFNEIYEHASAISEYSEPTVNNNQKLILSKLYNQIGIGCRQIAEYNKAHIWYSKQNIILNEILDNDDPLIAELYNNIAVVYEKQANYAKALEFHLFALAIQEKKLGINHEITCLTYNNIAIVYQSIGEYENERIFREKANSNPNYGFDENDRVYSKKAPKLSSKQPDFIHIDVARSYTKEAALLENRGNYKGALQLYNKALELKEDILGIEHTEIADIYNIIGKIYRKMADFDKALIWYRKADKIYEAKLGINHDKRAMILSNIGLIYKHTNNYKSALEYYYKSLSISERLLGKNHPNVASTYYNIANVYFEKGNYKKSLPYAIKAYNTWVIEERVIEKTNISKIKSMVFLLYYRLNTNESSQKWLDNQIRMFATK